MKTWLHGWITFSVALSSPTIMAAHRIGGFSIVPSPGAPELDLELTVLGDPLPAGADFQADLYIVLPDGERRRHRTRAGVLDSRTLAMWNAMRNEYDPEATWELVVPGTSSSMDDAIGLALLTSGELVAPSALVEKYSSDLEAIRTAYPSMTAIPFEPPWIVGELGVVLELSASAEWEQGQYRGLDALNDQLGVASIRQAGSREDGALILRLRFSEPYHPERLAELYGQHPDVQEAHSLVGNTGGENAAWGTPLSIAAAPPEYRFGGWVGWPQDIPYDYLFRVESGVVALVDQLRPFPTSNLLLHDDAGEFLDGEFDGSFPTGDGVPGGDFVMRFVPNRFLGRQFLRGNANADPTTDLSDAIFVLDYLFTGRSQPSCLDASDVDDSGVLDLTDAIYLLDYLFLGETAPPAPFRECGFDSTTDGLNCETAALCDH